MKVQGLCSEQEVSQDDNRILGTMEETTSPSHPSHDSDDADRKEVDDVAVEEVELSELTLQDPILKSLLEKVMPIDFYANPAWVTKDGTIPLKIYVVVTVGSIIKIAITNNCNICTNNSFVYVYTGGYWKPLDVSELKLFLTLVAIRLSVPNVEARHHKFKDELYKGCNFDFTQTGRYRSNCYCKKDSFCGMITVSI